MGILDKVVKIEKTIEKLAARKGVPVTPIEIRRAILDDIEEHVQPAGRSRRVFPYDEIAVEVLAGGDRGRRADKDAARATPPTPGRAELEAVLDPDEGFTDAIREHLHEAGCDRIGRLHVSVKVIAKRRADWRAGTVFQVTYQRSESAGAEAAGARARGAASATEGAQLGPPGPDRPTSAGEGGAKTAQPRQAQLVVLDGSATKKAYALSGERTNVGRLAEVTDKHRRIVRRNQVVFLDVDSEANQTVSRAQAHIRFTAPDEYRLFDDHSSYGTRIARSGRMIELPSGSPRGAKLQSGDEIYFGRARVVFQLK
jgi:hypothetical protein